MSLTIFKSGRAALEAARGTDTPPTVALEFDTAAWQQDVQTIRPLTLRSSYEGYLSAVAGTETNTFDLSGVLSYDMAIWLANTHIKAVAAGVKGVGIDYLWTFLPTNTSDDIKSASIQFGYADGIGASQPAVKLLGCLGDSLSLAWDKSGEGLVKYTSKMVTPSAAAQLSAFTGAAAAIGSTNVPSANTTAVTVDTTTIGATPDTKWSDLTFTLTNGFKNLYTLNNTTAATATFRGGARTWKLEGSRYYDSKTEWDAYIAKTPRKIRIKSTGPVVGSSTYYIQLDLYGVYTAMSNDEKNDLGFQKFTLEPLYNVAAAQSFSLLVDSGLVTIA